MANVSRVVEFSLRVIDSIDESEPLEAKEVFVISEYLKEDIFAVVEDSIESRADSEHREELPESLLKFPGSSDLLLLQDAVF